MHFLYSVLFFGMTVLSTQSCSFVFHNSVQDKTIRSGLYYYSSNFADATVSLVEINPSTFALAAISDYSVGSQPRDLKVSRDEKCLFVVSSADDRVTSFSIDQDNGELTFVADYATGGQPASLVTHETLSKLYISSIDDDSVETFDISTDCTLSSSGSVVTTNITDPWGMRVYGNHLMITDSVNSGITFYTIDTGTPVYNTINFLGANPTDFVYTGQGSTFNIYANAPIANGLALGLFDGTSLSWPGFANEAVSPTPNFIELYDSDTILISGSGDGTIMAFELNSSTGAYSSKQSMAMSGSGNPNQLRVLYSDQMIFVTTSDHQLHSYRYDPSGYTLSLIGEANTGRGPLYGVLVNLND